jgi:hypothetical protein
VAYFVGLERMFAAKRERRRELLELRAGDEPGPLGQAP